MAHQLKAQADRDGLKTLHSLVGCVADLYGCCRDVDVNNRLSRL